MKKTYILFLTVILSLLAACQKEENSRSDNFGEGSGALRLEQPAVLSKTEIPVIVMKGAFGMDANTFPIRIDQQGADGTYTKHTSFVSYSAMIDSGMPLVLPVGDYQVVVSSYDQAAAEGRVSETPYFEGKQDFVIEEKQSRLFLLLLVRLKVWEWRFACLTSSKRSWKPNLLITVIQ